MRPTICPFVLVGIAVVLSFVGIVKVLLMQEPELLFILLFKSVVIAFSLTLFKVFFFFF